MNLLDYLMGGSEPEAAPAKGQTVNIDLTPKPSTQPKINSLIDAIMANKLAGYQGVDEPKRWDGWEEFRPSQNVEVRPPQDILSLAQSITQPTALHRYNETWLPYMDGKDPQDHRGEMPGVDMLLSGQATVDPYQFSDAWMNDTRGLPIYTGSPGGINDLISMVARERAGKRK